MSGMDITVRTIAEDEFDAWARAEHLGFNQRASDEYVETARSFAELDRTFAAFDGGDIVGSATTRTSAIATPGGKAKLGYVDDVSVLPTHRRRGIMTRVMRQQLDQMRERGEPLAALSASESLIYERFGYGIATWLHRWKIDRRHTAMKFPPDGGGSPRFVSAETAREEWTRLHARVRENRVGMVHYDAFYWGSALRDAVEQRQGAGAFFHVAYLRGERIAGLCSYRIRGETVMVIFLLGEDAEVEAELWRYCFGIDLMTEIYGYNQPTDDPLPWRLEDPRRLERTLLDHTWLRLVDARAALEVRSYAAPGRLTFRLYDEFCPWNDGAYALEADPSGADCAPTDANPAIALSASDLAAVYLGGTAFGVLARAGRVEELESGALHLADMMFRTERAPWSLEL